MSTSSIKHKGSDSILYSAAKGVLKTSGVLAVSTWYKIKAKAVSPNIPDLDIGSVFLTPDDVGDAITLATGDEVWPLTLTEICKADVEFSGEMGVIETTDSCDYPYTTNIPDGFTNLSGSINTMLRFDEETDELVAVTLDFLKKFYTIVEDDGEGTYTVTEKDDTDILLFAILNKTSDGVADKVTNWLIVPAILNSVSNNISLKDVLKADYGWTKGQGPAQVYMRTNPSLS